MQEKITPEKHLLRPFFVVLDRVHTTEKLTSYPPANMPIDEYPEPTCVVSDKATELQTLLDAGDYERYSKKIAEYLDHKPRIEFRLSKGWVYEMRHEGKEMEYQIALQVKGNSLTWYFWSEGNFDQYSQILRDSLFNTASLCHKKVEQSCDLYYRGSNSVHIKLMHQDESESNFNHNHYRLNNNRDFTPKEFDQHIAGFNAEHTDIRDKFFSPGELERVSEQFKIFYADWTAEREGELTKREEYASYPSQMLTHEDTLELFVFGDMQEPCRIDVHELKVDYQRARLLLELELREAAKNPGHDGIARQALLEKSVEMITKQYNALFNFREVAGSRGLGSERASTRQIEGSKNPTIKGIPPRDDSPGKVPEIPDWAKRLRKIVIEARLARFEYIHEPLPVVGPEQQLPAHIISQKKHRRTLSDLSGSSSSVTENESFSSSDSIKKELFTLKRAASEGDRNSTNPSPSKESDSG